MKRNRNRSRYTVRYRLHPAKMRDGEKFYTGRVVHGHTIGLDEFVQLMEERGTTVRKTDSIAVIHLMETVIDDEICRGNVIDLPIGKFSLGLKGRFELRDHNNPGVEPFNRKKHRFVPQVSFRKEFVKRIELEHIIPERTDDLYKRVNRRRRKSSYADLARMVQERQEEDEQEAQVAVQDAAQLIRLNLPSALEEQDEVEQVEHIEQVVSPAQDAPVAGPVEPQLVRLNLPSSMKAPAWNSDQRDDQRNVTNRGGVGRGSQWNDQSFRISSKTSSHKERAANVQPSNRVQHPSELEGQEGPTPGELSHGRRYSPGRKGAEPRLSSPFPLAKCLNLPSAIEEHDEVEQVEAPASKPEPVAPAVKRTAVHLPTQAPSRQRISLPVALEEDQIPPEPIIGYDDYLAGPLGALGGTTIRQPTKHRSRRYRQRE